MNQKREKDVREGMRFLLARSGVSGFTRPDEFDSCGYCCCEAPQKYIGDYVKLMESFVGSFTPHRAGKRSVQEF